MKNHITNYIDKKVVTAPKRRHKKGTTLSIIVTLITFVLAVASFFPFVNINNDNHLTVNKTAQAGMTDVFCSNEDSLGGFMTRMPWYNPIYNYVQADASNRQWAGPEIFGLSTVWSSYQGEGGADEAFTKDVGTDRGSGQGNYDNVLSTLEGERNAFACTIEGIPVVIGNVFITVGASITFVVQMIATSAFNTDFICDPDPTATQTSPCFNLIGIIGGDGNTDGGLISKLTSSIYMPLLLIIGAISALGIAWSGIVKRELRKALSQFLWVCISVILGLAFLLNPLLLARAPMAITTSIATCVFGALNGENCFDNSTFTVSNHNSAKAQSVDRICESKASTTLSGKMAMTSNSLSCSIWKAFVLEPYAQGAFGRPLSDLDTSNPDMKTAIEDAGFSTDDFCVNMSTTNALSDYTGNDQEVDFNGTGKEICNLAVYELFLKTYATQNGDNIDDQGKIDTRWYKVIVTAASNEGIWKDWSVNIGSGMNKVALGFMSTLVSAIGGILVIVIAIFALIYFLMATIMMAFAPLFLLLGVHPTKGRSMFFGWVEMVVSSIFKHAASTVFLVVTLAFYSAVIGSSAGFATTVLFILILTIALFLYRGEIMEMFGKVNMGGQKFSNKFSEKMKKYGTSAVGGAVGGITATGSHPLNAPAIIKGAASGLGDGVTRELKRERGVVGYAVRQHSRQHLANKREAAQLRSSESTNAKKEAEQLVDSENNARVAKNDHDATAHELRAVDNDGKIAVANDQKVSEAEATTLSEMKEENPEFAKLQSLINQLRDLKFELAIAEKAGDTERADSIQDQIDMLNSHKDILEDEIEPNDFNNFQNEYKDEVRDKLKDDKLDHLVDEDERNENRNKMLEHQGLVINFNQSADSYNAAMDEARAHTEAMILSEKTSKLMGDEHDKLSQGQGISDSRMQEILNQAKRETDEEMKLMEENGQFKHIDERMSIADLALAQSYLDNSEMIELEDPEQIEPEGIKPEKVEQEYIHETGMQVLDVEPGKFETNTPNSRIVDEETGRSHNYQAFDEDGALHTVNENTPGAIQDKNGKWKVDLADDEILAIDDGNWNVEKRTPEQITPISPEGESNTGGSSNEQMPTREIIDPMESEPIVSPRRGTSFETHDDEILVPTMREPEVIETKGMDQGEANKLVENLKVNDSIGLERHYGAVDSETGNIQKIDNKVTNAVQDENGEWYLLAEEGQTITYDKEDSAWKVTPAVEQQESHVSSIPSQELNDAETIGNTDTGYHDRSTDGPQDQTPTQTAPIVTETVEVIKEVEVPGKVPTSEPEKSVNTERIVEQPRVDSSSDSRQDSGGLPTSPPSTTQTVESDAPRQVAPDPQPKEAPSRSENPPTVETFAGGSRTRQPSSSEAFDSGPAKLTDQQKEQIRRQAEREVEIETRRAIKDAQRKFFDRVENAFQNPRLSEEIVRMREETDHKIERSIKEARDDADAIFESEAKDQAIYHKNKFEHFMKENGITATPELLSEIEEMAAESIRKTQNSDDYDERIRDEAREDIDFEKQMQIDRDNRESQSLERISGQAKTEEEVRSLYSKTARDEIENAARSERSRIRRKARNRLKVNDDIFEAKIELLLDMKAKGRLSKGKSKKRGLPISPFRRPQSDNDDITNFF